MKHIRLEKRLWGPTFSAAGHGALEGARDGFPGFLLGRSLLQRHGADQLTGGGRHLTSNREARFKLSGSDGRVNEAEQ